MLISLERYNVLFSLFYEAPPNASPRPSPPQRPAPRKKKRFTSRSTHILSSLTVDVDVDVADAVIGDVVVVTEDVAVTVGEVHLAEGRNRALPSSTSTTNPRSHPYLEILSTVDRVSQGSEKCICHTFGVLPRQSVFVSVLLSFSVTYVLIHSPDDNNLPSGTKKKAK